MSPLKVNADNFARAETHRMFADLQRNAGGVNRFAHNRKPASVDEQTVIRMNRDTLYSFAVVDLSARATLTVPDARQRYLYVMVVNEDHYINRVFHDPGRYDLTVEEFGSPYVVIAVRTLVDPRDPDDLEAVAAVQDQLGIHAGAGEPFEQPDYDSASFDRTRTALLALASDMTSFERSFGRKQDVGPVRHLIGAAAGWGGLPDAEATYVGVSPGLPVGEYELTVGDVPVDGFWSISVYNADGFFAAHYELAAWRSGVIADCRQRVGFRLWEATGSRHSVVTRVSPRPPPETHVATPTSAGRTPVTQAVCGICG